MWSPLAGVEQALERSGEGITLADLRARDDIQVWKNGGALVVTQVRSDPMGLHYWLAGGRLSDVMALRQPIETWAKSIGCTEATCQGRTGWARMLGAHGYQQDGEFLRKAL